MHPLALSAPPALETETSAYLAAGVSLGGTLPSTAQRYKVNALVKALKAKSLFTVGAPFKAIWVSGFHDEFLYRTNLINPGVNTLGLVGTPTYTQPGGGSSNGTSTAFDTGINPSTDAVVKQNDNHMLLFRTDANTSVSNLMGTTNFAFQSAPNGGILTTENGSPTADTVSASGNRGIWGMSRTGSTSYKRWFGLTDLGDATRTSTAMDNRTIYINARNQSSVSFGTSGRTVGGGTLGRGLIGTEHDDLIPIFQAYWKSQGLTL